MIIHNCKLVNLFWKKIPHFLGDTWKSRMRSQTFGLYCISAVRWPNICWVTLPAFENVYSAWYWTLPLRNTQHSTRLISSYQTWLLINKSEWFWSGRGAAFMHLIRTSARLLLVVREWMGEVNQVRNVTESKACRVTTQKKPGKIWKAEQSKLGRQWE